MIRSEFLLLDLQRATVERDRGAVLSLCGENRGKLVQGGGDVALTGRFLTDGERVSGERFGSVIVAARASKLGQVAERGSHVRMIWAYAVFIDGQGPPVEAFGALIVLSSLQEPGQIVHGCPKLGVGRPD